MAKKVRIKRPVIPVPKSLDEQAEFLRRVGEKQRIIDAINLNLNRKVDGLRSKAMSDAKPYQKEISQLVEGLFAFAETNRDELTDGGKRKTVELPTGIFGWRLTPPSIVLRNVKSILKSLKLLNLHRFIRTKEEIDKEAMLKEQKVAKTVKGVSIAQHEEFIVKPAEMEVEITTIVDKLKKAVS